MLTTSTMRVRANFRTNRLLQTLAAGYLATGIVTAIHPLHPDDWLLENLLVFAFVPLLVLTYRRFPLSDLSWTCAPTVPNATSHHVLKKRR